MPKGEYWAFSAGQSGVGYYILCRVDDWIPNLTVNTMFAMFRDTNSSCSLAPKTGYQSYNNSDVSIDDDSALVGGVMYESPSQCPFPSLPAIGIGSEVTQSGFLTIGHSILPDYVNTSKFNSMLRAFDTALSPDEDQWSNYIQHEPSRKPSTNAVYLENFGSRDLFYTPEDRQRATQAPKSNASSKLKLP